MKRVYYKNYIGEIDRVEVEDDCQSVMILDDGIPESMITDLHVYTCTKNPKYSPLSIAASSLEDAEGLYDEVVSFIWGMCR